MQDHASAATPASIDSDGGVGIPSDAAVRSLAREVVLRLSRSSARKTLQAEAGVADAEVERFCAALVGEDTDHALEIARRALAEGLSFDALCEARLAPAARRLGTLWEEDKLSFAEVTLAANRLFAVLRGLAHRPVPRADTRFAVFANPPGEEHVLGVTMAAERARGAGWDVALVLGLGHDEMVARMVKIAPDVIGLSLSSPRALLPLTRLVVALRIAVPASPVVVSGPGVAEVREPLPGVDVMTPDFDAAMAAMDRLAR